MREVLCSVSFRSCDYCGRYLLKLCKRFGGVSADQMREIDLWSPDKDARNEDTLFLFQAPNQKLGI